jgi:hypothetical protein
MPAKKLNMAVVSAVLGLVLLGFFLASIWTADGSSISHKLALSGCLLLLPLAIIGCIAIAEWMEP